MASDLNKSNLQEQKDCSVVETYKGTLIVVFSFNCRFDQLS